MKERLHTGRKFSAVVLVIVQVILVLPWILIDGKYYNTYMYLFRMFSTGDFKSVVMEDFSFLGMEWTDLEQMMYFFVFQLVLLIVLQFVDLLNLILTCRKESVGPLSPVSLVICGIQIFSVNFSPVFYFDNWITLLYIIIIAVLHLILLLGSRMIDSWEESTAEQRQIKERDKAAKKERKERLAFEGKYSSLFYTVIWKNFKANWEAYRIFILVAGLSVSFVFAGIGMQEMMADITGAEDILSLLRGQGLVTILLNFLVVAIVISIFLIVSVFMFYLKNHMSSYTLFVNLGMRSMTLYLFVGMELLVCTIIALVAGSIIGNGILAVCRIVIRRGFEGTISFHRITAKTYLFTLLVIFLIYLISAMATRDIYIDTGASTARYKAVLKEKMPGKLSPVFLLIGAALVVYAVYSFARREKAEGIQLFIILFVGLYFFLRNFWNFYLRARRKKLSAYFRSLLKKNYFYHHFKTAFRYLYMITLLHIGVLFVFARDAASDISAERPENMFPYDYVCMAVDEEEDFFREMEDTYGAEVSIFPMVRVTSVDNSSMPDDIRECMLPQGQNIGISESTYLALCKMVGWKPEELNLEKDGSEIYVIYQEDESVAAHPLDYYADRVTPRLHIGQPVLSYNFVRREEIFVPRTIVGSARGYLVGNLQQGEHENIVVFSDAYFETVKEDWKYTNCLTGDPLAEGEAVEDVTFHHWPDRLVLMNVPADQKIQVEKELESFADNHFFDFQYDRVVQSWYSKDAQMEQIKAERFMHIAISIFIMVILTSVTIILLYMKAESEMNEKKKQQEFLKSMGMREKERIKAVKSEIQSFFWIPFTIATVITFVFTAILWRIRMYTQADCINYLKAEAVIYLLYAAIQWLGVKWIERYILRKVEGHHGRNH